MAGKSIDIEQSKPSYDEVISELSNTISKLIVENSIMKINIRKLEELIQQHNQGTRPGKEESF